MVDALGDGVELVLDGALELIGEAEVLVGLLLAHADDFLSQGDGALAALGPVLGEHGVDAQLPALCLDELELGVGVCGEGVDGHHAGQLVDVLDVAHMLEQVGQAGLEGLEVFSGELGEGDAGVVLEGAHGGDDDHGGGLEAGEAALDVEELLGTQVGAETCLGDGVVAGLHGKGGCLDGVATVGDVGEGAAVDEGGGALQGLDQVGLEGVLQQGRHGAFGLEVVGGDGLAVVGVAHDDAGQALLEVGDGGGQAEDGHDLGCDGDVEAVLAGHALLVSAQAVHDVAELAVVHVDGALPGDLLGVDAQGVALLDVVVEHSGQQVVGCTDGVEVAGEVEVDVLHGDHLGVAAAGSAALDAEDRAQGGLAQSQDGVLADLLEAVCQADGRGGLALAGRGGVDGGDEHQLAVFVGCVVREVVEVDLGLGLAVELEVLLVDAGLGGDLCDVLGGYRLGDLDIGGHGVSCLARYEDPRALPQQALNSHGPSIPQEQRPC